MCARAACQGRLPICAHSRHVIRRQPAGRMSMRGRTVRCLEPGARSPEPASVATVLHGIVANEYRVARSMRHIGILAHSADGAALCFLEIGTRGVTPARRASTPRDYALDSADGPRARAGPTATRCRLSGRISRARLSGSRAQAAISSSAPTTQPTWRSNCRVNRCRCQGCTLPRSSPNARRRMAAHAWACWARNGRWKGRFIPLRSPATASRCGPPLLLIARWWTM